MIIKNGIWSSVKRGKNFSKLNPNPSLVRLATTTSTNDTGLLCELVPAFNASQPLYEVQWTSVGTGAALDLGRVGMADVCLTHAQALEEDFVNCGFGLHRQELMYNNFVVVGDNTQTPGVNTVFNLFQYILSNHNTFFVSRADNSGTNNRELEVWSALGITNPAVTLGNRYIESGLGMRDALNLTAEMADCNYPAYCLSDDGTWFSAMDDLDDFLQLFSTVSDKYSRNQYAVLPVNPNAPWDPPTPAPIINALGAAAFEAWLLDDEAETIITEFVINGHQLFTYNAHD